MIVKRSLSIRGHRTSISLEDAFWVLLQEMAARRAMPLARLVAELDAARDPTQNLSSSLRLAVLDYALEHRTEKWDPVFGESDAPS